MSRNVSRVLWVVAGVLLIVAGVLCLASPSLTLSSISLFFGVAMLLSGVVDIVIFAVGNRYMAGAGWFLVDGILTVLLSLFILFNQWFTALTLPFIFGMWLMCSGISKFANSFELRRLGVRGWGWFTALGLILAALGGVFLILQGIASILRGCLSHRFWL